MHTHTITMGKGRNTARAYTPISTAIAFEAPKKKRVRQMYAIKSIKIQSNIRVGRTVIRIREGKYRSSVERRLIETATQTLYTHRERERHTHAHTQTKRI